MKEPSVKPRKVSIAKTMDFLKHDFILIPCMYAIFKTYPKHLGHT